MVDKDFRFIEPFPEDGRKCLEHVNLFSDTHLAPFNFKDFYYAHPGASKQNARAARESHDKKAVIMTEKARAICRSCPFIDECRNWAVQCMKAGLPIYGVTGGTTQEEQLSIATEKEE